MSGEASSSSSSSSSSTPRAYRSTLRSEQAAQTRRRILDAAAECFSRSGYAGTSLADIAEAAGVSTETVKLSGPKRLLLLGAFERAFAGTEGSESLGDRPEPRAILELADNDRFLESLVGFIAEANRRTSALWGTFVSAAATDPVIGQSLAELLERRRTDYRMTVATLDARGMLQTAAEGAAGVDDGALADALSFLLSPESHAQLVTLSGWSMERYRQWLLHAVRRLILEE